MPTVSSRRFRLPARRLSACLLAASLMGVGVLAGAAPASADGTLTAPTLTLAGSTRLLWTVTLPDDPDLTAVHLRYGVGSAVPASPTDGVDLADYSTPGYSPGQEVTDSLTGFDPNLKYTVVAFAVDSSNAVTSTTVVRPAATEAAGSPVTNVGYQALGDGTTEVFYPSPQQEISSIRYAVGTTAPETSDDGTAAAMLSSAWGTYADIPAAAGQKVSVSMFNFSQPVGVTTTYQAERFTFTGGTSTDVLLVKAVKSAVINTSPTFTAALVRYGPQGTVALSGIHLDLYAAEGGSSSYASTGIGAITDANGTASFTPHFPQTVSTTYQVRADTAQADPLTVVSTFAVPTTTSLTAKLSRSTVKRGHGVTITGQINSSYMLTVDLQRNVDGTWKTLAHVVTVQDDADKANIYDLRYKFSYRPATRGRQLLRVYFAGTKQLTTATSPALKLTVQ